MKRLILFAYFILVNLAVAQFIVPQISFKHDKHDFGTMIQGTITEHTLEFSNTGRDTLKILNISSSCGCSAALISKKFLTAGEVGFLKITYDSHGKLGYQTNAIHVYSNDPHNQQKTITITANVIIDTSKKVSQPKLEFSKTVHDFGNVEEGKIVEAAFEFKNTGKGILEITDVKTSCGCTAAIPKKRKLSPGESSELKVELDTTNRIGAMSRLVTIKSNDPDTPEMYLTVRAEVIKK